jgi:uncharacterized protein YjiS (DUF1127 family)
MQQTPWSKLRDRRVTTGLRAAARAATAWLAYELKIRRDTESVLGLSDHLLADIGLSRHELRRSMRKGRPERARDTSRQRAANTTPWIPGIGWGDAQAHEEECTE